MAEIRATTQEHLDIEDIKDDLVLLKGGQVALVLQTTAINFDLLSEKEQDAMIAAYSGLLNSLSFPVQIAIRSKRMDISSYLEKLAALEREQGNEHLKERIKKYQEFVKNLISKNEVLDKRFYIVLRYGEVTFAPPTSFWDKFLGRKTKPSAPSPKIFERAKTQLAPRRDHLLGQLEKIGVRGRQLTTSELTELFYDIYNPALAPRERLKVEAEYTAPIVEPAVEG